MCLIMNKRYNYSYSVLKYRPSLLLDERVNLGLLFVFPEEKRVEFVFPKNLARLASLYPEVSLCQIEKYLKHFENKAKKLTGTQIAVSPSIIEDEFLIKDSNSFFFDDFKSGNTNSIEDRIHSYFWMYFTVYEKMRA